MATRNKSRVLIRKEGGDDGYQWALRLDGRLLYKGMTRDEAAWRKKRELETLALAGLRARGMLCTRCGAVLSAVTFTCSRGEKYCS